MISTGTTCAALRLRSRVIRLAELHDVDAVLAQRGANGRRRVGLTGRDLELDQPRDLLLFWVAWFGSLLVSLRCTGRRSIVRCDAAAVVTSDLLHLVEGKFNRGLAAEDRHQHLEFLGVEADFGNRGGQRGKRTVDDGDGPPTRGR